MMTRRGAHLPFDHEDLESKNSDDEGENPQGDAKKPDILAQFDKPNSYHQKLEDEIRGGTKWLQKPQKANQAFSKPRSDTRKGGRGIVHRPGWY